MSGLPASVDDLPRSSNLFWASVSTSKPPTSQLSISSLSRFEAWRLLTCRLFRLSPLAVAVPNFSRQSVSRVHSRDAGRASNVSGVGNYVPASERARDFRPVHKQSSDYRKYAFR